MVSFKTDSGGLTAILTGEIDHHTAKVMREEIDRKIQALLPDWLDLDFGGVTLMDSSGIGLIMGRYRNMEAMGGTVSIKNAGQHLLRVMRFAGLERLVRFE